MTTRRRRETVPASGTDEELRDAIDPATARDLRLKCDWQRENDAFAAPLMS